MPYAKLSNLKEGDKVRCDNGFTCIRENEEKTVYEDSNGDLYIECDQGSHYLDGQLMEDNDNLVGIFKVVKDA